MKKTPLFLLCFALAGAAQAQQFFDEAFNGTTLPATLEQSTGGNAATFDGTDATFPGVLTADRSYLRTDLDDFNYATTSFVAEVTVTIPAGGESSGAFFGMGLGDPKSGDGLNFEPAEVPSVYMRLFPEGISSGEWDVIDQQPESAAFGAPGAGTHRLRMIHNAITQEMRFEVDEDHTGTFVADHISTAFSTADNGFGPARIFFGGTGGISFDELSIAPMTVTTVTNTNDTGAGSLRDAIENATSWATIFFDPSVFTGGTANRIPLGSALVADGKSLIIDASTVGGVTLDAGRNDRVLVNTNGADLYLKNLKITGGEISTINEVGGGIFNDANLRMIDCEVFDNQSMDFGGGVANEGPGVAILFNCAIYKNHSAVSGGGIFNVSFGDTGVLTMTSCTIHGNSADGGSGGVENDEGIATLSHCTITANSGGGLGSVGTTILGNTVVAANIAPIFPDINLVGVVTITAPNFIGDNSGAASSFPAGNPNGSGDFVGTTVSPLDPRLGPLGGYGGPTLSVLPRPASPLIDAGATISSSPATDQRGVPRSLDGGPDLGATEFDEVLWDGNVPLGDPTIWDAAFEPSPGVIAGTNWTTDDQIPGAGDAVHFPETASSTSVDLNGNREVVRATISGTSNYALFDNTLTLSSGNLAILDAAAHTISSNVALGSDGAWDLYGDLTLIGLLQGAFSLTKRGPGTLTHLGANTYSGGTTVTEGTLLATNPTGSATGTGPVQVNSGATLGGTGTVAGNISVATGGMLAPGSSVGTLGAGGNVALGGTYTCEIGGADADRLNVTGDLDLTGATLDFSVLSAPTGVAYIIASYGSLTGAPFSSVSNLPAGYFLNYAYNDGSSSNFIALVRIFAWDGELLQDDWDAIGGPPSMTNWDDDVAIPGRDNPVVFADSATDFVVDLNGDRTVYSIAFTGDEAYTLDNDTLTVTTGSISTTGIAFHTINSNLSMPSQAEFDIIETPLVVNGSITVSGSPASLTKTGGGTLILGGPGTYGGGTTVSGGILTVSNTSGSATGSGPVQLENQTLLTGTGSIAGDISVGSGAILFPGEVTGPLNAGGDLVLDGLLDCFSDGSTVNRVNVSGDLDITNGSLSFLASNPLTADAYIIASYGTLTGSSFSTVTDLPTGYTIDYSYDDGTSSNHIALVDVNLTAYSRWAFNRGLTFGVNDGMDDDPNNDGRSNRQHFAFDTDPLGDGSDEGKMRTGSASIFGIKYFSYTFPVRAGAVFLFTPTPISTIDGVVYTVLGDTDLQDPWDLGLGTVVPAQSAGLPALGDYDGIPGPDWEYRTFRLATPFSSLPKGFMRVDVVEEP